MTAFELLGAQSTATTDDYLARRARYHKESEKLHFEYLAAIFREDARLVENVTDRLLDVHSNYCFALEGELQNIRDEIESERFALVNPSFEMTALLIEDEIGTVVEKMSSLTSFNLDSDD